MTRALVVGAYALLGSILVWSHLASLGGGYCCDEIATVVDYIARNPVTLWWYDPLTNQSVPIGTISGEFPVQAEFILRGAQQAALEVPYRINADFGLTAISEAVWERMKAAGYSQSVEAYVLRTDDTQPK